MANLVELIINGQSADLGNASDVSFQLDRIVSELRDPLKKTGTVSVQVTLPYTAKNKEIFGGESDRQLLGKFRKQYAAQLVVNNVVVVDGTWLQVKNTSKGFVGAIGEAKVSNPKIGDLLKGKKLAEIKSFAPLDFSGTDSVANSWQNTVSFPDAEVCFPYVVTSFSELTTGMSTTYEDLGISHFAAATLRNIFVDAGYTVDGEVFGNETFQKLVMLYSSSAKQVWNYGKLAPMRSECAVGFLGGYWEGGVTKRIERDSDYVYVFSYPFQATQGDLCTSLGTDGVYTCKFSGTYTLQVRGDAQAPTATNGAFTTFRCISDDETIPDNLLPNIAGFSTISNPLYLDNGTLAVGNTAGNTDLNFTARLVEGKQYAVQRYISVNKATADAFSTNSYFIYNPNSGKFHISAVDGPLLVNPALFLPDIAQTDFVNAMFKVFNLYYQLNQEHRTITLFTRNAFYKETLADLVDLNPYLDIDGMDELPLSDAEIAKTYLKYTTDESDHILKYTGYLDLVNGEQPDESTALPFAPLGFLQVTQTVRDADGVTDHVGDDLLPAILPAQDSEDTSVLTDVENYTTGGSWTPRLLLYHGNNWYRSDLTPTYTILGHLSLTVNVGRMHVTPGNIFVGGGIATVSYDYTGTPPKLSFFDASSQPAYTVTTNTTLRSFALELATTPTIYDNGGNGNFLGNLTELPALQRTSLATNVDAYVNPKGFFYKLYANDLLIGQLSNYYEGQGRMNPDLFTRLNGRQTLRLGSDLFLLESVKSYDVRKSMCVYKLYKLVSNTSTEELTVQRFTSTKTVTLSCAAGLVGSPSTGTATRVSYISQAAADAAATTAATAIAQAGLVCSVPEPTEWTSTQSYTAQCGGGYQGNDVTSTQTYTSSISQQDADTVAYQMAIDDAQSRLQCDLIE